MIIYANLSQSVTCKTQTSSQCCILLCETLQHPCYKVGLGNWNKANKLTFIFDHLIGIKGFLICLVTYFMDK